MYTAAAVAMETLIQIYNIVLSYPSTSQRSLRIVEDAYFDRSSSERFDPSRDCLKPFLNHAEKSDEKFCEEK
jgi:hypothetical protein